MQVDDIMQASRSPQEAPIRLLLAADDDEVRNLVSQVLRSHGYVVIEARTGPELLAFVRSMVLRSDGGAPVELVIADVAMPDNAGLRVLSELRQSDWNTAVVLMSAFVDAELRAEATRLGAIVLYKPFDLKQLLWFVRQATG